MGLSLCQACPRCTKLYREQHPDQPEAFAGHVPADDVDANEILGQTLRALEPAIRSSGASVTHGTLPSVRVHQFQLEQLFQNLIGNALKFSQPGHPPVVRVRDVSTAQDREAGLVRLTVSDEGIGFDPRYAERIFDVFEQLSTTMGEGTGVGLAICRKIVERHGGRIYAESLPGAGATFTFTLRGVS